VENREFPEAANQVCEVLVHRNYFSSKDSAIARKYDVTRLAGFEPHDNIQDQVRVLNAMYSEQEG